jgi:phage tail protein X
LPLSRRLFTQSPSQAAVLEAAAVQAQSLALTQLAVVAAQAEAQIGLAEVMPIFPGALLIPRLVVAALALAEMAVMPQATQLALVASGLGLI